MTHDFFFPEGGFCAGEPQKSDVRLSVRSFVVRSCVVTHFWTILDNLCWTIFGPWKVQYCFEGSKNSVQKRGPKGDTSQKWHILGHQKCNTALKEAKRWSKRIPFLERPGFGWFAIDFRADVCGVVTDERTDGQDFWGSPAQKHLRGHLALQV